MRVIELEEPKLMIITVLDTETTGLDVYAKHKIIELCMMFYDGEGNAKGTYLQRFNPNRSIDQKAQAVHGISRADLENKPVFGDHAPKISKLLAKADVIVAHNAEFDLPFIYEEVNAVKASVEWSAEIFCTMVNGRGATGNGKVPNLGELCFAYGVDYKPEDAHAADYDVDRTAQCFFKGLQYGDFVLPETNVA